MIIYKAGSESVWLVVGALYRQCDDFGKCQCKRGVTGDKCDRCDVNFYDFGQSGCR